MMRVVLRYLLLSVLYIECIAGVMINLIIVAANIMKWRTIYAGDKILISLAASRGFYLFHCLLVYISPLYEKWLSKDPPASSATLMVTTFLHSTNLWLATVLCVFYCVKITSYSWKFFIFLKTKISSLVPWFLLASLLISFIYSLPFSRFITGIHVQNLTNVPLGDVTPVKYIISHHLLWVFLIGSCPPFLMFLVAIFLLLHSLWMHIRRMRSSGSGFHGPNLESHFSAARSMSFFLVLQIIYLSCMTMYFSGTVEERTNVYLIVCILTFSPPALHSLYIISSNRDLKKTINSMFCVTYCAQR